MGRRKALTDQEAIDIREMYYDQKAKWSMSQLARHFRVSDATIARAVDRKHPYEQKADATC